MIRFDWGRCLGKGSRNERGYRAVKWGQKRNRRQVLNKHNPNKKIQNPKIRGRNAKGAGNRRWGKLWDGGGGGAGSKPLALSGTGGDESRCRGEKKNGNRGVKILTTPRGVMIFKEE